MNSFLKQIETSFELIDSDNGDSIPNVKDSGVMLNEHIITFTKDEMDTLHDKDGEVTKTDTDGTEHIYKFESAPDDIEESSTSAGAGAYNTPRAFAPTTNNKKATAATGMTLAPKGSLNTLHTEQYNRVQEKMDTKYEHLIEGYKSFALGNPGSSPTRTVNASIREVAKQLKNIEETINHTIRLKTESGIAHSGFTNGTLNAVRKISERLIKISERVRSLGE